jgi:hypothetical protein
MKDEGAAAYPMASRRAASLQSLSLSVEWFWKMSEIEFGGLSGGIMRGA